MPKRFLHKQNEWVFCICHTSSRHPLAVDAHFWLFVFTIWNLVSCICFTKAVKLRYVMLHPVLEEKEMLKTLFFDIKCLHYWQFIAIYIFLVWSTNALNLRLRKKLVYVDLIDLLCVKSSQWHNILKNTRGQGQTREIICALLFSYCSEEGSVMYVEAHAFTLRFAHSLYTRHRHGNRLRDGNKVTWLAHLSLKHWKYSFKRHQTDTWDSSPGSLAVIICEVFFCVIEH